jgi:hypothetical protein
MFLYPTLMKYDGSLHDLVDLVAIFKMILRSSKSESGCSSYECFSFVISTIILGGFLAGIFVGTKKTGIPPWNFF